jgi:hypothetical protein
MLYSYLCFKAQLSMKSYEKMEGNTDGSHYNCARNASLAVKKFWQGKAIPVTGRGGPSSCETSRLSQYLDNRLTDGDEVRLMRRPFLPPGRFLLLIYIRC